MSINACTISRSTIDTFCSPRREQVLNDLIREKYGTQQAMSGGARTYARHIERDEPAVAQAITSITVGVEFMGMTGVVEYGLLQPISFVNVLNLDLGDQPVGVNTTILSGLE